MPLPHARGVGGQADARENVRLQGWAQADNVSVLPQGGAAHAPAAELVLLDHASCPQIMSPRIHASWHHKQRGRLESTNSTPRGCTLPYSSHL